MRGIGLPAFADSSRTILYSTGASCSLTCRACMLAIASLSENQNDLLTSLIGTLDAVHSGDMRG